MHEAPLTQDAIDHSKDSNDGAGLYSKLAKHPYLAGGALLASAGVALAATKLAIDHANEGAELKPKASKPRSTAKRGRGTAKKSTTRRRAKAH